MRGRLPRLRRSCVLDACVKGCIVPLYQCVICWQSRASSSPCCQVLPYIEGLYTFVNISPCCLAVCRDQTSYPICVAVMIGSICSCYRTFIFFFLLLFLSIQLRIHARYAWTITHIDSYSAQTVHMRTDHQYTV